MHNTNTNTTSGAALRRRTLCAAAALVAAFLAGCASTAATTRYDSRPNDPMAISSLRVIFVERQFSLAGERPWLTAEQVNAQRAQMGTVFQTEFPKAMEAAGVTAEVKSFADPINYSDPAVRTWFGRWPAQTHVMVVEPSGGRIFCTGGPCNFRFGVDLRVFSNNGLTQLWAATLQQPDLTPNLKVGHAAEYEHFSREIARVLLQDTTARPRP